MEKLIITLALTGNVPTKALNESTPMTPEEIADQIEEGMEQGVSIAHLHARDENGEPTHSRACFEAILNEIQRRSLNVITQCSTGARGGENTPECRGQMLDLPFEMASLSAGSSNFPDSVNANSPRLIAALAEKMYANGIKPEIEAFDSAMITNTSYLLKKGILKSPLHFNMVMNVPGSIAGSIKNLLFMSEIIPPGSTWTVCGIGSAQVPMLTAGILLGGHVRTGLEDTLSLRKGVPATNRTLVERVLRIAGELGREIASPAEAREILGLKAK
ncbi:MAG: hypothetical protein B0D92_01325 [Spirochaeta sp. LUC14_002_19_P3]|nr:MAG: hypothetical protein B0D92_01325 [Spirochaeta sp. LUC14_002_19_P3]